MKEHKYKEPAPEAFEQPGEDKQLDLEKRAGHLLHCPACRHFIKGEDINIDKLIARCCNCDHVFNFDGVLTGDAFNPYKRPEMLIPNGLEVLRLYNELDVQINWFRNISRSGLAFYIVFTLVWNLILLPFVLIAIFFGEWHMLLFSSLHILVGVGMLFRLLAIFINTSHLNVTRRWLNIRTSPIAWPFRRNRRIPVQDIRQLYVTQYEESRTNDRPNYAYALHAILKNGEKLKLIRGMNLETMRYLEHEIESFLRIENVPVKDEYKGDA